MVRHFGVAGGKTLPEHRVALRIVPGKLIAAGGRDRNQARPEATSIRRRVPTLIARRSRRAIASGGRAAHAGKRQPPAECCIGWMLDDGR